MKLCTYCGEVATDRDHVVPRSFLRNTGKPNWRGDFTVWSCRLCNGMLGSKLLFTIQERAGWLFDRYQRYTKLPDDILARKLSRLYVVSRRPEPVPVFKPKPEKAKVSVAPEAPRVKYETVSYSVPPPRGFLDLPPVSVCTSARPRGKRETPARKPKYTPRYMPPEPNLILD